MACNLFIAYDLLQPGQNYEAVRDRIKSLGQWPQFQLSLFYVHTSRIFPTSLCSCDRCHGH